MVDTPIDEAGLKRSNGLHPSQLNSSSESSSSDDEDSSNGGKKSAGTKGGNIAILNKTKIDTDFISKLIGNRFPGDKRYDPNEINKLRLLSHSYQNFAVKLLVRLFDEEEIIGRNVYGRNYSGDKSITKQPLDPERINFIKETVLRLTKTNNPELAWASCVIAMNRKMVDINNKVKSPKTMKIDVYTNRRQNTHTHTHACFKLFTTTTIKVIPAPPPFKKKIMACGIGLSVFFVFNVVIDDQHWSRNT
ncbi:hypothetical protein BpHYR1_036349 [Brachionus plicatilis]|uniref:BEN domain-containing protein n=1 Tax=Brachionus plicatilis TaxID=10195 RepID=A0A3M7QT77_BRAPC|nr:hypothetical protein BpHYR1_036349 [Brachionus plicatilis]